MNSKSTQCALVLAPHPDDESLGCGGTIKLITSAGGDVDVLYMTRGENGAFPNSRLSPSHREEIATRRKAEAERACQILGVRKISFLPGNDGRLQTQPHLVEPIVAALSSGNYRSVFCPWPYDAHVDHVATYGLLYEALKRHQRNIDIWLYEVWSPLKQNICISIDATIESKLQAFGAHESQATILNYAQAFQGLARYRSLFCPPAQFAEAFYNCDRSALLSHENIPWPRP